MGTGISSTNSTPQTIVSPNKGVDGVSNDRGKTPDSRSVTVTEVNKQIPEATDANKKIETSLADRNINLDSEIATPEDFQARIKQIQYFNSINQRIDSTAAFSSHGIHNGASKTNPATSASASVLAAFNSINNINGEKMIAFEVYDAYARDMTLPAGATPHGARIHLENAFNKIQEMKSLNNELDEFPSVDVALALATNENRTTLEPHIRQVFGNLEDQIK